HARRWIAATTAGRGGPANAWATFLAIAARAGCRCRPPGSRHGEPSAGATFPTSPVVERVAQHTLQRDSRPPAGQPLEPAGVADVDIGLGRPFAGGVDLQRDLRAGHL